MANYVFTPPHNVTLDCAVCGTAFSYTKEGPGKYRKFCSKLCNRSYDTERERQRRQDSTPPKFTKPKFEIVCQQCGKVALRADPHRTKYCSYECYQARYWESKRSKWDKSPRICLHCKTQFLPKHPGNIFCCKHCKNTVEWTKTNHSERGKQKNYRHYLRRRAATAVERDKKKEGRRIASRLKRLRTCKRCSKVFDPKEFGLPYRYCSLECKAYRPPKPAPTIYTIDCAECGKSFESRKRIKKFCTPQCGKALHRRIRKMKLRALVVLAEAENVNPYKVFVRDKWICQLCGVKTPRKLRGSYQSNAPELDHIVPLSLGGEHSYRNTQCACRQCNGSKGAKPLGQMRLVA